MKSIIQKEEECFICKSTNNLHEHHIYHGTDKRTKSEELGLKVYLCANHHNMVHKYPQSKYDKWLKQIGQLAYEENHSREDFISVFKRNYIDE